jgi:hypothetical protein
MKAIKQAQLREILDAYNREEISYSRMNEMLNELADKFAVGFSLWKEANTVQDDNGMYYSESRIQVSRKNPVDIDQLMIIYKKQNGL